MKPTVRLCVFSLLCVVLLSGFPAGAQQTPGRQSIDGVVVDNATGQPISRATITLRPAVSAPIETGSDGHFRIESIPAGEYVVTISKDGYMTQSSTYIRPVGQLLQDMIVHMSRLSVVTGRLLDTRGSPVVGALAVPFWYRIVADGRKELTSSPGVKTDDRGVFRLFDLPPDRYLINFSEEAPEAGTADLPASDRIPPALYPGVDDISKARYVEVKYGEETRLADTVLTGSGFGAIRIRLINRGGEPKENVRFALTPASLCIITTTERSVSACGGPSVPFRAGAGESPLSLQGGADIQKVYWPNQPGLYEVSVRWENRDNETATLVMNVDFTGQDSDVDIDLRRPRGSLTVRATMESPNGELVGVPGIDIGLASATNVRYTAGTVVRANLYPTATTASDGTAHFPMLAAGRYDLTFLRMLPPDSYIAGIRQESRNALIDGIVVSEEDTSVEIRLRTRTAVLQGKVTDGFREAVPNAVVALLPEYPLNASKLTTPLRKAVATNPDGSFELSKITPGRYRLYAWSRIPSFAYLDPDFMKTYEERGIPIHFEEHGRQSLNVTILD